MSTQRVSNYPIAPWILDRRSPRSMTGESLTDEELLPLFEAARWAPSSFNGQPWRFLYAKRDTPAWALFFDLLVPFNQTWTKEAACLVLVVSKKTFDHNGASSVTHSYDTGAAWMNFCLEGCRRGLVVHGMAGFDYEKARKDLGVPDGFSVEAMAAVGKLAPVDRLPQELRAKEVPSQRKALEEVVREGVFTFSA